MSGDPREEMPEPFFTEQQERALARCEGYDEARAASPDERLREAVLRANEDLLLIADEAPEDVGESIDSVRAAIKDALAAADREAPDEGAWPDQSAMHGVLIEQEHGRRDLQEGS